MIMTETDIFRSSSSAVQSKHHRHSSNFMSAGDLGHFLFIVSCRLRKSVPMILDLGSLDFLLHVLSIGRRVFKRWIKWERIKITRSSNSADLKHRLNWGARMQGAGQTAGELAPDSKIVCSTKKCKTIFSFQTLGEGDVKLSTLSCPRKGGMFCINFMLSK